MDNQGNPLILQDNQPRYGYFEALYRSFYSSSLYIDVAKRWKGFGFLYLLLVVAILVIPFSVRMTIDFNRYFTQVLLPVELLPDLVVQNGQVIFDKPMPYFVKNNNDEVIAIIDTTGQINKIDNKWPQLQMLITKNTLYTRPPALHVPWLGLDYGFTDEADIFETKIPSGINEIVSPQKLVQEGGITMKRIGALLVYPVSFSMFASIIFMILPITALIGQLVSQVFFSWPLKFAQACRLMAVANTPVLCAFFGLLTTHLLRPKVGFILLAILIIYFCLAVTVVKRSSTQVARL